MWTFGSPTRVTFGVGASGSAIEVANSYGGRPIIVTDATLAELPRIRGIIETLPGAPLFTDVHPNPTVADVDALAASIREHRCDVVVAIGGGSPMDCAKAAACLCETEERSVRAFHSEGRKFGPVHLPVVAVPTTAGTGSEVTPFSVLDDAEKGFKGPIASDSLYPIHALVDPELTLSLPKYVTAATGLDALSHAIEGYWSKNHQPLCDLLAMEAAKLIFAHFGGVCTRPDDVEARTAMSYAALLAGMAFALPKNAMVHACSFPLSNRYHLCHGAACAFTLEFAVRLNAPHMGGRLEVFAKACGFDTIDAMARRIGEFKRLGGLPCTLADVGIGEDAVPVLIEESFHPLMQNNPKEVTREDLARMYEALR
jgi:alcohol dehydrogenase class IV